MQTAPLDLEIHGTAIRVVCDDPDGAALLRGALAEHLVAREAPLGFVLEAPREGRELAVLTDRCGFVLARTRTVEQALAVLGGHLTALLPATSGSIRYRLRALLSDEGFAALAAFPLLAAPPVIERRIERSGWRMVDRLTVDVDASAAHLLVSDVPWAELATLDPGPGHVLPRARAHAIQWVFLPEITPGESPSVAAAVHALASGIVAGTDREASLTAAEQLTRATRHRSVSLDEPNSLYERLIEPTT